MPRDTKNLGNVGSSKILHRSWRQNHKMSFLRKYFYPQKLTKFRGVVEGKMATATLMHWCWLWSSLGWWTLQHIGLLPSQCTAVPLEDRTFLSSLVQTALYSRLRVPGHSADTKEQKQLKTGFKFFRVTRDIITCRFNHYDGMAQPSLAENMYKEGDSVHSSCVE